VAARAAVLFALALGAAVAFEVATSVALPERVASHFGAGGAANGWMSREGYLVFIVLVTVGAPVAIVLLAGVLPRIAASIVTLPHRDYWLAPARREATLDFMLAHACRFGMLLVALLAGVHWLVAEANAAPGARLDERMMGVLLVAFAGALVVWLASFALRFRRPRA
jgi:uncharacterized membrane protein